MNKILVNMNIGAVRFIAARNWRWISARFSQHNLTEFSRFGFNCSFSAARSNQGGVEHEQEESCDGKTYWDTGFKPRLRSGASRKHWESVLAWFTRFYWRLARRVSASRCRTVWMKISCRCWCTLSRTLRRAHSRSTMSGYVGRSHITSESRSYYEEYTHCICTILLTAKKPGFDQERREDFISSFA